mgnify:CR=1 FL=1
MNVAVDEFAAGAREWLAAHASEAPPDYGAICPPDLVDHGVAWHRALHDAGYAAIHWPTEHGGRGLAPEHHAAWMLEAARAGVPAEASEYRLGNRSGLEWVLDQHKEKTPRDPTIRARFNTYRFADYREQVIELLRRVTTVSVETMKIVNGLPTLSVRKAPEA